MKTYFFPLCAVMFLFLACSKDTTDPVAAPETPANVDAQYTLLLQKQSQFTLYDIEADGATVDGISANSNFGDQQVPQAYNFNENIYQALSGNLNCSVSSTVFKTADNSLWQDQPLLDYPSCDIQVHSLGYQSGKLYLAIEEAADLEKEKRFLLLEKDENTEAMRNIELPIKPIDLVVTGQEVVILALDEGGDGKNKLLVIDQNQWSVKHQVNLDFDARGLWLLPQGDLLVGYDHLHVVLDSNSFAIKSTIRYATDFEPDFIGVKGYGLSSDAVYYPYDTEFKESQFQHIAAIYEFEQRRIVLYYYENFLTENERNVSFDIGTTTAVGFDSGNKMLLIGYQKATDVNQGGLLRIRIAGDPQLVDQTDLPGVPRSINSR